MFPDKILNPKLIVIAHAVRNHLSYWLFSQIVYNFSECTVG